MESLLWPEAGAGQFLEGYQQAAAFHMQRSAVAPGHYAGVFSSDGLWQLLQEQELEYGTQVQTTARLPTPPLVPHLCRRCCFGFESHSCAHLRLWSPPSGLSPPVTSVKGSSGTRISLRL
jgi:hypothetical protein